MCSHLLMAATALSSVTAAILPRANTSGRPGIDLTNASGQSQTYYLCNNEPGSNGNGTANPAIPCEYLATKVTVQPSRTTFVPLGASFKGRLARSTDLPATWVEIEMHVDDQTSMFYGYAVGDVSLSTGCDGPATVGPSEENGSATVGFDSPLGIVSSAPSGATTTRDGKRVIAQPYDPRMNTVLNSVAADYLKGAITLGTASVYIDNTSGTAIAVDKNNVLKIVMY